MLERLILPEILTRRDVDIKVMMAVCTAAVGEPDRILGDGFRLATKPLPTGHRSELLMRHTVDIVRLPRCCHG